MEGNDRRRAGEDRSPVLIRTAPRSRSMPTHLSKRATFVALVFAALATFLILPTKATAQQIAPTPTVTTIDVLVGDDEDTETTEDENDAVFNLDLGESEDGEVPSQSIVIILTLTLLSVAPALLLMMTSFTRIVIVLSLTRNALGLTAIPPNQVIVGLALFLSLFTMAPTLKELNEEALQPFLNGEITQAEAFDAAEEPIREYMLGQVNEDELELFMRASSDEKPETPDDVSLTALVPAYVLSELKTAFIIGFVVFVPFLVIDLVVSSSLMSMGMMMLPPVLISLPFKLLLFVMVDGWNLVVRALLSSFQ
jgi:flagellar biosynthetic protein FliP